MADHYRPDDFESQKELGSYERVENYDVIYRHDHAVLNAFKFYTPFRDKNTQKIYDDMVPMIFATPRREYSERDLNNMDDEKYTAMEWEGDFPPVQHERLIFPSVAVTRLDIAFDASRFTVVPWRQLLYSNDLNLILKSQFPLPYTFSYQFDFWTLFQAELNMFMEQWARKFPRPTWWIDVQFPPPWGEQTVHTQNNGVFSNTSVFETGEEQRALRGVGTINVHGWIPLPTEWVRTIQKISLSIIEDSSQEILETYETELADKQLYWDTGDKEQVLEWL